MTDETWEVKSIGDRLRRAGESLRLRKEQLRHGNSFNRLRRNLKSRYSSTKGKKESTEPSTPPLELVPEKVDPTNSSETYTNNPLAPPTYVPEVYPAIPRYI